MISRKLELKMNKRNTLNACSWGNYWNGWVFVNYRVWSRPTLSGKCLEITLVMI